MDLPVWISVSYIDSFSGVRKVSEIRSVQQLARYDDDHLIANTFDVLADQAGYFVLIWKGTQTEVYLDVTGLVVDFVLPPVTPKIRFVPFLPLIMHRHC